MSNSKRYGWRLSSLKQLVLLSFLVVVTPFGVLIYYATDALVEQSAGGRVLAKQALEVTRRGQRLEGLAEDITRSARQYQILAKPEIKERLTQYLSEYKEQLAIHSFILTSENKLNEISSLLAEIENSQTGDANSLLGLTREVNNQIDLILDKRLQALNETAYQTQTQLSSLAIVLLIIEMLLILFFSFSIIRPVRRIADRIQALGTGEEYTGAMVGGPHELVELEKQLDWLTERLAEVENEKQRFLRHMSHELKTPLTTLREGSDLLADQITGPLNNNQMEITQLLQSNSRQLQSLIEQLLDYSRLHQNEPVNLHLVALLPALNEAIEPYKLLIEQKRIQVSLPESEQEWMTDRAMLIRIIGNLVSNAALYGSDNGRLILQIQSTDSECVISVENDGPTIPEKDVPQLFEPFYQGQNRRQGPVKGSGIGLSIVRDAAESLGASVELSTNENNRVGFSLYLPVLEQHLND
ncbi:MULTISPECIES: HAMP domain-containing sensor histidine kinase [unclassified Neptuniibacter]|uniref:sensor histidine kinase n=1 Tax=unclassified Neptuniibacter TaxID=2630693 RepID=UPI000C63FEAD|nr:MULTISPECIES: HAMP domain-containing sensor histidine kinase [unclassified Neptuniibacter]MAY41119.1 two-component sensor histidine kinase [Oceanospirillaceae bacterium]|tara:strand:+ start:7544 stop:8953 length:1410 start_codon:yes stop_codon:yes gene_type:complete